MGATREAPIPIVAPDGRSSGTLWIRVLPRTKRAGTLLDFQQETDWDRSLEPVQLMEEQEYLYDFSIEGLNDADRVTTDHPEIFEGDDQQGRRGRLRPRLHTGALHVKVSVNGTQVGRCSLEVRSAKLDYMHHYRWMLGDIAEEFTEIIMERFSATEQRFEAQTEATAATLYQRFAFIQSLLASGGFETAMQHVLSRPHRRWESEEEYRPPGRGVPSSSTLSLQWAKAGPRELWPGGRLRYIPSRFEVQRSVETLDTPENRFVKFALTHWLGVVLRVGKALSEEPESGPNLRGRREAAAVIDQLSQLLSAELFDEVGPLDYFPAGSQVLQRRTGYREVFRAYVQSEAAAALRWEGSDDVFRAGQKNVAALYEFWVYLQLAKVVAGLCDEFRRDSLVEVDAEGLGIALKRGWQNPVTGQVTRHNRRMQVDLFFNKTFGKGDSWTLPMRPDCSIRVSPCDGEPAPFQEVWVHFDAKYKVDNLLELFGRVPDDGQGTEAFLREEEETEAKQGTPKHADLLKMHAYKDAIRRSAGAYVLYPGLQSDRPPFTSYHELLPGLGAFALRPAGTGTAEGADSVAEFLNQVLDHVATQHSQYERSRYWISRTYDAEPPVTVPSPAAPFITAPPADTRVLLGYVKSAEHRSWIRENRLYNVRTDGRRGHVELGSDELAAELALLYSDTLDFVEVWAASGRPVLVTRTGMEDLNYPDPRGDMYYCLTLRPVDTANWPVRLTADWIMAVRQKVRPAAVYGAPVAATWLDVIRFRPTETHED